MFHQPGVFTELLQRWRLDAPKLGVICDMEIAKRDILKKFPKGCFFSVAKKSQRDINFRRHNKKELAL